MWKNDQPDCHAGPPAPAPAADMQQRPGQENADDDRCTVVQPSKRLRPDVQRFAPTLRDHADAGMTESMAVDAAVVDPIPIEPCRHADETAGHFDVQASPGPVNVLVPAVNNSDTHLLSRSTEA
jgi:hypothetical protein